MAQATIEFNRNEQITIGTSTVIVSDEKQNSQFTRNSIIIINTSTGGQVITLSIDNEAVAGRGIQLGVGGSWQDSKDSGYLPTQRQVSAISSLAGGTISLQERTGV